MKTYLEAVLLTKRSADDAIFRETLVADRVQEADTFLGKLRGLIGKRELERGEGLLLRNCSQVHTYFMQFPIDVVYLAADGTVLDTQTLAPWKKGKKYNGTKHTLELAAGTTDWILAGTRMILQEREE